MLLTRKRVFAAKIESSAGTPEALSGSDATINVFDASIEPTIEMEDRQGQGAFGKMASVPGARTGRATFRTEITGDGSGGIPAWASKFLPACGWVATSKVYTPRTEGPGTNVKTITLATYENGIMRRLHGAMGTFEFVLTAGKIAAIEWTFDGIYTEPSDVSILTPTYLTHAPFRFVAGTLTLGSWAPVLNELRINAGNTVILREDGTKASGVLTALVTDRTPTGSMDPEAVLVATVDHGGKWMAGTLETLTVEMENATDIITIEGPKCQRINVVPGDRNGNQTDQIDFQFCKSADAGDDELSIEFAAPET